MTPADFKLLGPEMTLVAAAAVILVADIASVRRRVGLSTAIAAAGAAIALWLAAGASVDRPQLLLGNIAAHDAFSLFFKPVFAGAALLAALFSIRSRELVKERHAEYLALMMIFTAGMMVVASAANLVLLYLAMELIGISAYALTAFNPGLGRSTEAGLKYAIFGAVSSGIMLFGISLFFGLVGSFEYGEVRRVLHVLPAGGAPQAALLVVAILFIMAGFVYKVAAVPFHAWCPDAYEGAPTPFTALMSVAPKAAGFAAMVRFFVTVASGADASGVYSPLHDVPWPAVLGVISAATMTFGNLAAITQSSVKRMLAYSSIAHAGYMLMGVVALSNEGVGALCVYVVVYLVMNMGAFLAVLAVGERAATERIDDWRGIGKRHWVVGLAMAIFLFSLTGLPPFAGFVGKFYLFSAVLHREGSWYVVLAVVGILNSVISLYYYMRVVRVMYLEEPRDSGPIAVHWSHSLLLSMLAIATIVLGLTWNWLAEIVARVARFA